MADRWWVLPWIGCELVAGLACHSSEWWWCREGLWVEEREEREKTEIKMNSVGLCFVLLHWFGCVEFSCIFVLFFTGFDGHGGEVIVQ